MPDTRNPALLTTAHVRFPIQYIYKVSGLCYPYRYPDIRLVISGVRLDQLDTGLKKRSDIIQAGQLVYFLI